MTLTDEGLIQWARASAASYEHSRTPDVPTPAGVHGAARPAGAHNDVRGASDVATIMPVLFILARYLDGPRRPVIAVEFGTDDGSTAIPVLKAVAETGGHLHSVDPGECVQAHRLVDTFGYRAHWTHHKMPSDYFFIHHHDVVIDLAFVDGDHRWPVVERDLRNLYDRLRPGGIIVASDYGPFHGSVPEFLSEHDGSTEFREHVPQDPHGERQMADGVAKASHRVCPTLVRAQTLYWPIWPNPCLLIRKLRDGEIDPARP